MLRFQINNESERKQLEHGPGPIEFGRGPGRDDVPRCTIRDVYVSKDHVRVEELSTGLIRVENLSQKHPILLPGNLAIPAGESRDLAPTARLTVGYTTIEVEPAPREVLDRDSLGTIAQSIWARRRADAQASLAHSLAGLTEAASPERLTECFEAVIAVQRATPGSPEFYQQTAEEADRAKGWFLATVSHELRTPSPPSSPTARCSRRRCAAAARKPWPPTWRRSTGPAATCWR